MSLASSQAANDRFATAQRPARGASCNRRFVDQAQFSPMVIREIVKSKERWTWRRGEPARAADSYSYFERDGGMRRSNIIQCRTLGVCCQLKFLGAELL
jgi:hypothetical protein